MGAYDSDIQTAAELIKEFGEACTLVRFVPVAGAKDWEPAEPTDELLPVHAAFLNFNLQTSGTTYWNGTEVLTGDKKVLIAAAGLAWDPELQGQVRRADGSVWKIQNVKLLDPNGQKILFTAQVRK